MEIDEAQRGGALAAVVHEIAHAIEAEGTTQAIFGAPTKLDEHTIVPVASLELSIGGGMGGSNATGGVQDKVREAATNLIGKLAPAASALAGGGGFSMRLRPVGFLSESDGRVVFTPIETKGRER